LQRGENAGDQNAGLIDLQRAKEGQLDGLLVSPAMGVKRQSVGPGDIEPLIIAAAQVVFLDRSTKVLLLLVFQSARKKPPEFQNVFRTPMTKPDNIPPHDLLLPTQPNHVWHMDLTSIRLLWLRFTIAAILDGFSRKLLALKVFVKIPKQTDVIRLVRATAGNSGKPQFLITDHGTQFRKRLHEKTESLGIHHVKAKVRALYLNGKWNAPSALSNSGGE
jgi:hypothetical protein